MYIQRKLRLSDGQERKLARAAGKGEGLKLRLSAAQLAPGAGGIPVSLTTMRDKSVSAAANSGKGVNLEFSPAQIASMKCGGGIPPGSPTPAREDRASAAETARHWRR